MTGHTHRWIGVAATAGVCAVADPAPQTALVALLTAYAVGKWPDSFEKPFRPLAGVRWAGRLGAHRTWTHWPIVGVMVAVGAATIVDVVLAGVRVSQGFAVQTHVLPAAVFVGVLCGYLAHVCGDALTTGGVPLLGPASRRDMWLLPKGWRIDVFEVRKDVFGNVISKRPSKGDQAYRYGAMLVTVLIALQAAPT